MHYDFIHWRGHTIRIKEIGRGKPLLLVNGLGGHTDMWAPLAERLTSRRIISFDAPGTGRSSTPPLPVSIAELADLAAAVLDYHNVISADVVGYSYGGAVAQQLAYQHPSRIRRLVLAATTFGIGSTPGCYRAMSVLATPFRYYSETYFERTADTAYGGRVGRNPEIRQRMLVARRRHPPSSYGYAMQVLGGASWSSWHFLDQIQHKTLVVSGDDDPLIPVANAKMLAQRIPQATLQIIERGGHLMLWDDARNLGRLIREFINAPEKGSHAGSVHASGHEVSAGH